MLRDLESINPQSYQNTTDADTHHCQADSTACVARLDRTGRDQSGPAWRAVHERLRTNARTRAELDAEEARALRQAVALEIWRRFGRPTVLDYLEHELGYGPRDARDRLRVARALGELPEMERALAGGQLKYSAVRELTRVAVRANEQSWLEQARCKTLRQIEELVSGRRRGDNPEDPITPDLRLRRVPFEDISPETYALLRQARTALADEHGHHLSDDELLATVCRRALETRDDGSGARASHQVAVTVCEQCKRGWQIGGGRMIELAPEAVDRATCDASHIGSLAASRPARVTTDIPPATRRLVMQRDHGRCTVPGCRSARGIDLHHIIHRQHGGDHDPGNLSVVCHAHHQQAHAGLLEISGRAPDQLRFVRRDSAADSLSVIEGDSDSDVPPGARESRHADAAHGMSSDAAQAAAHVGRDDLLLDRRPRTGSSGDPDASRGAGTGASDVEDEDPEVGGLEQSHARLERSEIETQTQAALVGLGFRPAEARAAVEQAATHVGHGATSLEQFLRVALSKTRRPTR